MTIQELLVERKLTSALIVDDGYDAVPRSEDIAADDDAWSNFIADVGDDHAHLVEVFPAFDSMDASQLRHSNEFVAAAWSARDKLRPDLWNLLFSTYEQATRSDRAFLERLETALKAVGVTPVPSGRQVPDVGREAGVVFADLFLGTAQEAANIELSIERLKDLLKGREDDPPIVILMSRSELLDDKKAHFRDAAKLLGAMFRVYRKQDLLEGSTLERALERLALHRPDAVRVARFLRCWELGLAEASTRFLNGIRRLDLSDYVQVREVLLTFEGQPLGSYILDVFDRVLQHEIEGDADTINAAEALNEIDPALYPAPYIAGSTDLQDLVYRSIWQNPHRLDVKATTAAVPVGFGDVLVKRVILEATGGAEVSREPDAFVVLTPACDLVRDGGVKRIMLVAGKLSELTPKTWTYKEDTIKTPIIVLPNERRMWVRWDAKDIRTLLPLEIEALINDGGSHKISLRLRESHALELQQRVLAAMGRVGLIAQMPATFPVGLSAYSFDAAGVAQRVSLPKADREGGVCYTGRDADGDENSRLVLTEPVIDELLTAIGGIAEDAVNQRARETLKRLKASTSLATDLQRGLKAPASNKSTFLPIKAFVPNAEGPSAEGVVGMIARNPSEIKADPKHNGFIIVLTDEVSVTSSANVLPAQVDAQTQASS